MIRGTKQNMCTKNMLLACLLFALLLFPCVLTACVSKESGVSTSTNGAVSGRGTTHEAGNIDGVEDKPRSAEGEKTPAQEATAQGSDAANSDAVISHSNSQDVAQSPQASTQQSDLQWRDVDFAVDPSRTEWSFADNGRKVVYLTIDDGPSPRTPEVLDILDRYNCKATFFVVGADPNSYHYIKEAYNRGHTIGLHTFSHDYASVYSSTDAYFADLAEIAQIVKEQIGYVPCFIRFPGGSSNAISADYCPGIMSVLVESVQAQGYQYYDWNVSFGDGSVHTSEELVGYVKEAPLEENIVLLCHDSEGKQTTVEALPTVIEYYQGLGYSFEALDRSTWVPHHGVSN